MASGWSRVPTAAAADPKLGAPELRVAIVLGRFANGEGRSFPSLATIALNAAMDRRNVSRSLLKLEARGYLKRERRRADCGDAESTVYTLVYDGGGISQDATLGMGGGISQDATGDISQDATVASPVMPPGGIPQDALSTHLSNRPLKRPSEAPRTRRGRAIDPTTIQAFETWWPHYPRHVAKQAALEAFAKATKSGATLDQLVTGADRYAAARRGEDPTFTAHPTTWLNGGRWADEPQPAGNHARGGKRGVLDAMDDLIGDQPATGRVEFDLTAEGDAA